MMFKDQPGNAKEFRSFLVLVVALSCFVSAGECLYEDQVGKFDWCVFN